jgi:hypothetical protein
MTDDTTQANLASRPRSFREVLAASDEDHDKACQLALIALGTATGCSPRAAQRLLDGLIGAGLGTMVVSLCDEADMALDMAIGEAIRRQQEWGFGHEDGMRHGVSHAAPFLSGWAQVYEAEGDGGRGDRESIVEAVSVERPRNPDWQQVMGVAEEELPPGVEEAFQRVAGFGFVQATYPTLGKVEVIALCLAAAVAISTEAEAEPDAVDSFLKHSETGRAFGLNVLAHWLLDPEHRAGPALIAAIRDGLRLPLPAAAAAHFGADATMPRLVALTRWHEMQAGEDGDE